MRAPARRASSSDRGDRSRPTTRRAPSRDRLIVSSPQVALEMDDVEVDQIPQAFPVVGDVLGERCGRGEKLGDAVAGGLVEGSAVVPVGAVVGEVGAVHDTGVLFRHNPTV